jgi:rod shape-determining protein MreD
VIVRAGLVLFGALVLQAAVVAELELLGAHGEVLWLVPIVAGLTGGPERGAIAGFAAGLAVDLLVLTPFGLTALAMCVVGYGVGAFQAGVLRTSRWLPIAAAVVGSAVGTVLFAVAAEVVGVEGAVGGRLAQVLFAVVAWNVVLIAPALRIAQWVERPGERRALGVR